jgi:hypothetical protein
MKIKTNFNEFRDSKSLELKVPTFCFVIRCVSAHSNRRYIAGNSSSRLDRKLALILRSFPTKTLLRIQLTRI